MDVFPKFIIEDGNLILSKCIYHKDLVTDETKVKGGGLFKYNAEKNMFTLYGASFDYGAANTEDIKDCISAGKVYSNTSCTYSIADKHNFQYVNIIGEVTKLK
jgi:hypothetical protein